MSNSTKKKKNKTAAAVGRVFIVLGTFLALVFVWLYVTMFIFCHGPSESGRNLFVSTIRETGALRFLAKWYFSEEEILAITSQDSMKANTEDTNTDLINIQPKDDDDDPSDPDNTNDDPYKDNFDENGIEVINIAGRSFEARLMKVKDPSKVFVGTIYPWRDLGLTLDELCALNGAIGGVNGGEYESSGNSGGSPIGVVVSNGQIQWNSPQYGDCLVGLTNANILYIKDISGYSATQVEALVAEQGIRDAVTFKDLIDSNVNHFTKLIVNGVATEFSGSGSGANPRTAIGQRSDGTILLLTCDGRGAGGHIGATAADIIGIMQDYGAVNAANLDGGSSSSMYYNGEWLQNSVTMYYATSSWRLPDGFLVKGAD